MTKALPQFVLKNEPTAEETAFFQEYGYIYYKGFFDLQTEIEPVQHGIHDLLSRLLSIKGYSLERQGFSLGEFDSGLQELLKKDRAAVGQLYDMCKALPCYIALAAHKKHEIVSRALLGSSLVGFAPRGYGIRMDHPNEEKFLTQLHQDYISQLCSQHGVVFWSPLRHTDQPLGPVKIFLKSHKDGVFPIIKHEHSSKGLQIQNEDALRNRFECITPEVGVGDCVIIHYLTLHESSPNLTQKTRWAMLSRYFDFNHPSGAAYGWKGGIQEGNFFDQVHPELTVLADAGSP